MAETPEQTPAIVPLVYTIRVDSACEIIPLWLRSRSLSGYRLTSDPASASPYVSGAAALESAQYLIDTISGAVVSIVIVTRREWDAMQQRRTVRVSHGGAVREQG